MKSWLKEQWRKLRSNSGDAIESNKNFGPTIVTPDLSFESVQGDSPIRLPEHDAFGIDPFAKAIAKSIAKADATDGLVYAINGAWGSGKSSAINLILHHLADSVVAGQIIPTAFNPWWFAGAEALTISFFQEMRATVGKSLDEKARETMASLGSCLSAAGPLLGAFASLLSAMPAAGLAVTGGTTLLEKLTRLDTTVEKDHRKLASALAAQGKTFLIVLDDIDRLNTDDALQIFKLIKSVGRLPNVIYLMAFDRQLAENMVAERFPAEGASYLEKVVQGAFDLPPPDSDDLRNQLLKTVGDVMGAPSEDKMQRFWNVFYDAVAPLLKTPRDTVRLSNAIKVSWPAVAGDVDRADFLAIEAFRMFLPTVHGAVRSHSDLLTGKQSERSQDRGSLGTEYNSIFLDNLSPVLRKVAKTALLRLFPRLEAVWGNTWNMGSEQWQRDRLICSPEHFQTYFAFSVTNDGITLAESDALVAGAGTPGATKTALMAFLTTPRKKGGTRAALALNELQIRAVDVAEKDIQQLVTDLFSVADDVNVASDADRGFMGVGSNPIRLHWLINSLLRDRLDIAQRTEIIRNASVTASFEWIISLSDRCKAVRDKRGTSEDSGLENLVDDDTVDWLYLLSLERVRAAAADRTLTQRKDLISLLFRWKNRSTPEEVRTWTDTQLEHDDFIVAIASCAIQEVWSHGIGGFGTMGDRVARKSEYVNLEPLSALLNLDRFQERVATMLQSVSLQPSDRAILQRFTATPNRDPSRLD